MDKRREAAMSYKVINVITAIDYIEEHLSEKLDLDIVANAVHYSKYHLHRTFTTSVGLTMHDYISSKIIGIFKETNY